MLEKGNFDAFFREKYLTKNNPVEHAGDHLGFIMLVGYKAIRKLVVMSVAFRAAEPADHKILFHAAFLLPDT